MPSLWSRVTLQKNVLVATEAAATCLELLQGETSIPIEAKDVLRTGYLEGVTANLIQEIVPRRHASLPAGESGKRIAQCERIPGHGRNSQ